MIRELTTIALCGALLIAAGGDARAQAPGSQTGSMMIPGLGSNFSFNSENAVYRDGALHATGSVMVRSDQFDIDCDELVIDQEANTMVATGTSVQLQTENLTALGGMLTYNMETKEMLLERGEAAERPCIIQENEDGSILRSCAATIRLGTDEELLRARRRGGDPDGEPRRRAGAERLRHPADPCARAGGERFPPLR